MDSDAMLEFCRTEPRINQDRLFVCGRSLGGAVAIHLLERMDMCEDNYIKGALIENTFTSISDMTDKLFSFVPGISVLKLCMLRLRWDSFSKIKNIKTPIFFISGDRDTLVPPEMTDKLSEGAVATKFKETWLVAEGEHNNTFIMAGQDYIIRLNQFFNKCIGDQSLEATLRAFPGV